MENVMSTIFQPMAALALVLVSLAGYGYKSHAAGDANPVRVAEMKQSFGISGSGISIGCSMPY